MPTLASHAIDGAIDGAMDGAIDGGYPQGAPLQTHLKVTLDTSNTLLRMPDTDLAFWVNLCRVFLFTLLKLKEGNRGPLRRRPERQK